MKIMNDYYDFYLKVDVLLLACVFKTFRKESINSFELGYWWLFKRFTCVTIKLILDIEKYQLIESMIRRAMSMICKGYAEANNKILRSYNPRTRTPYIRYLDVNNLNGHSMM